MSNNVSVATILESISDEGSLELFRLIAREAGDSESLRSKIKLTRKQYYSRLFKLTQSGLVKRKENQYVLTALGRVVHDCEETISTGLANYWKIKAIDSIDIADGTPNEEQRKLLELLIKDQDLKKILSKDFRLEFH
ncbi:MAG: hypothetical protein ABI361_05360 [Nitrososphaera sp.]|jgi:DNA-binding HxlR family transcriptional regulator